jgi:hypothetical protein
VRRTILPITLAAALIVIFTISPVVKASSKHITLFHGTVKAAEENPLSNLTNDKTFTSVELRALYLYEQLGLGKMGLAVEAMKFAYKGFENLRRKGAMGRNGILTICDFSQSSKKKRLYIIDVDKRKVLFHTYVAHGKNSGLDYANRFSNTPESLQSSLGFYITKGTYVGKHGLSLRLDGVDRGWNDKAEERAVVVHGADYIGKHRLNAPYMGRSFGCPAVPKEQSDKVINLIKYGTCLFLYHPSNGYLHGSRILND